MNNSNKTGVTKKSLFFNNNGLFGHPFFLFIILSIIHIILLLYINFDIKFAFLTIVEFLFFLYFSKFNLKIIIRIFQITILIFLLNIFFTEGKIIFNYYFLRITEQGLINGLKKAGVLMSTLFFTINILKDKNNEILLNLSSKKQSNLILKSIEFFLVFVKELGENNNIKLFFYKIIKIYRGEKQVIKDNKESKYFIKIDFFIYNFLIFIIFILIYLFL